MRTADSQVSNETSLDALKWLALALMAISHLLLVWSGISREIGVWVGRPVLPLLALIIALRLNRERASGYIVRLLGWGLIAQPVYQALLVNVIDRLNIMFTLAAGVAIWMAADRRQWAALIVGIVGLLYFQDRMDFGGLVPVAIALAVPLARRTPIASLLLLGLAASLSPLSTNGNDWKEVALSFVGGLSAIAAYWFILRVNIRVQRQPGWFFYAFYPAHLLLIHMIFGPYTSLTR